MGKKKRYIHRAAKFSKKAFNFLDKVDGQQDGDLTSSKIDNHISRIVVTDRGNQTMSFVARCHGPGDTTTGNLEGDHVIYTVDGVTLHGDAVILIDHQGTGRDKNLAKTLNSPALNSNRAAAIVGGNNTDVLLSPGTHTIVAAIYSEDEGTKKSEDFVQKFNIARSEIVLDTSDDDFLVEGTTDGNIKVDLTKLVVTSGKQPGVEADYSPTQTANAGRHGYRLSVVDAAGATVKVGAGDGTDFLDITDGNGLDAHDDLLRPAYVAGLDAADYTYTVTFTPLGSDDAPLSADAVSKSVTITKDA